MYSITQKNTMMCRHALNALIPAVATRMRYTTAEEKRAFSHATPNTNCAKYTPARSPKRCFPFAVGTRFDIAARGKPSSITMTYLIINTVMPAAADPASAAPCKVHG